MPYRCQSRNHGLCAFISSCLRFAAERSLAFIRSILLAFPGRLRTSSLNFLEPRLPQSHSTVIIPLDDGILFVGSLNCTQLPSRDSEVTQTLDAISGIQY